MPQQPQPQPQPQPQQQPPLPPALTAQEAAAASAPAPDHSSVSWVGQFGKVSDEVLGKVSAKVIDLAQNKRFASEELRARAAYARAVRGDVVVWGTLPLEVASAPTCLHFPNEGPQLVMVVDESCKFSF
jgi:hypothetical protein